MKYVVFLRNIIFIIFFISSFLAVLFFAYNYLSAAGSQINPDGAGNTSQGTRTTCTGVASNYECVNDGVSSTTVPSTTGDFLTFSRNLLDSYTLSTITNVATATAVTVFMYHKEGSTNMQFQVSLWNAAETVQTGTTQNITISTVSQWNSVSFTGLTLNQAALDALRVRTTCTKPGTGGATTCISYAVYAYVTYTPVENVTVSASGTMQNLDVGTTSAHVGGGFVIKENSSGRDVTSITINETGTVDGSANLDNIKLRYDLDIVAPYDCTGEVYNGTEAQFGSTDTDGFSAANGLSTFTDTVAISTTQALCVYPVLDVLSTAVANETIDIQISNPSTDVIASGSPVIGPVTTLSINSVSTLQKTDLQQIRFHWRNDDGSETLATSATGGTQDTDLSAIGKLVLKRLRFEISNEGNKTSGGIQYRVEYASKVSTCAAASGWTDVGAVGGDWDMSNSTNLTEGANTTNIASGALGAVTDENTTFLSSNSGVKDTSSQTASLTLLSINYVELEYALAPTNSATDGGSYCFRLTNAGSTTDFTYTRYPVATISADMLVTASSTQASTITIPTASAHVGGLFVFKAQTAGPHTISSVTITASGTVDFQNDLDNIKLVYDLDTSAPYTCIGQTYGGGETQYGSTDTDGFSSSGTSTFTGSVSVSATQSVCLYVVVDVGSSASNNETLDVHIANPSTDVNIGGGNVAPNALLAIPGVTTLIKQDVTQIRYHWRNDNGSEVAATSASGGAENTAITQVAKNVPYRLRFEVSNEGAVSASGYQYRIEYAQKISVCSAASGWTDVGAASDAWDMVASQLVEASDTTNIATGSGGVTDENTTFLTPNGGQRETTSQTGSLTLSGSNFVELEYSLRASTTAVAGATYCFRVSNAGTALDTYTVYPEATIKEKTDFFIQRGVATTTGTSVTITAGVDYVAPSASTSAFVRITNTHHTGAGDSSGTGNQNANNTTAYILNPWNITSNITFARVGTGNDTRIDWEIIEYIGDPGGENEIKVRQQQPITYVAANTTVTTVASPGVVDDADVAVFITGQANPNAGRTAYNTGLSTAAWNAGGDTATFTRGEAGANAVIVSYAVIEFTGANWAVQRTADHTYTNAGTTETESITSLGSLSRAFIHAQKRVGAGLNQHEDFGHEVWLSSIGQVSFRLDTGANTPSGQVSVAWVIENTQTVGTKMIVTRSNGTQSGGTSPFSTLVSIGKTLTDIEIASIFINNSAAGAATSYPEPMIAARIFSTTQYELWMSDTSNSRAYQTEIVEWPTAARKISQNYYRFYVDNDALLPTTAWPCELGVCGENTEVTGLDSPITSGGLVRIRMSLQISAAAMNPSVDAFKLEFAPRTTTCSAISSGDWQDVGAIGSTTAKWRGYNTSAVDGTSLSTDPPVGGDLLLSVSDIAGSFEEENNSVLSPFSVDPGEDVEYDWVIQDNSATEKTVYCFRMTEADGKLLSAYNFYPTMRTAGYGAQSQNWRWYDDAQSETPLVSLAATNTAPIDIDFDNSIDLRVVLREINGAAGVNVKYKLQFSESSSFSTTTDVQEIGTCTNLSYWCYANGGGVDNATITTRTVYDADACVGGVGTGCGTHNESGTTTSSFVHHIGAATEFGFTLRSSGARTNRVYYFRVYDVVNNEVVPLASGKTYPSLVTKGASLTFTMSGLPASTVIAGVTLDITTTPTQIAFGSVPANTFVEGAHRLSIDTNGTEGHQILMMLMGDLLSSSGAKILPVTGTNVAPTAWATGCGSGETSCLGYHTTDATLRFGSTRFSAIDTYARFSTTTPEEVSYNSQPVIGETTDLVFRLLVRQLQDAGQYENNIRYISIPIF